MAVRTIFRRIITTNPLNPLCFLDIEADDQPLGRVIFELRKDIAPMTCENFRKICIGGFGKASTGDDLWYKGCIFDRIIPGYFAMCGDVTFGDGRDPESIYGGPFNDENFTLKHDRRGVLSMVYFGKDQNGCEFFITLGPTPWLDGIHVAFGRLVQGRNVLNLIEACGSVEGIPRAEVRVTNCGEIVPNQPTNK